MNPSPRRPTGFRPVLAMLITWPLLAAGQDEMPGVPDEQPAVSSQPAPSTKPPARPAQPVPARPAPPRTTTPRLTGMTVIGDEESPLGLIIMPWRRSAAAAGLDRPARLLQDALLPMDENVFRRQVNYYRALTQHLQKTGRDTPY